MVIVELTKHNYFYFLRVIIMIKKMNDKIIATCLNRDLGSVSVLKI